MNEREIDYLKKTIEDAYQFRDKFFDFELDFRTQLLLSQLDLLKTISSIIAAFLGVFYFFYPGKSNLFSLIAFVTSICSLIFIFSYHKEIIDDEERTLKGEGEKVEKRTSEIISKATEGIEKQDVNILINYIKANIKDSQTNPIPNYLGEIILFLFYLILFTAIVSVFYNSFHINKPSTELIILISILGVSWFISFKEWSMWLAKFFSKQIKLK